MTADEPARTKGRPKTPTGRGLRKSLAVYKGSVAYADWLQRVSRQARLPVTTMLDVALAEWAEKHGYEPPPPRLEGPAED